MTLKTRLNKHELAVWIGIAVYTAFFTTISFFRYEAFSYTDFDFAIFAHECWKILHGSGEISIFQNTPIWGNALELISVVTSPFLLVSGFNPKGLLFFQALALGLGAYPVFLIARHKGLPERWCVYWAIGYLLNPSVWFTNLYEYNPLIYSTLTLLTAFYFFQTERFRPFMLFIFLSLINRADLGVVTFMFGVYALVRRRPWKWVIAPSLASFLWVAVGLLVVIPKFKNVLSYDSAYPQFGNGFGEVIKNMVLHPQILWQSIAIKENGQYFLEVLYPVGFLSLLGLKEFLICGLSLIQHLISVRVSEHSIHFHYTATITPFVYISAIYGMARLTVQAKRSLSVLYMAPVVLSLTAVFVYGPMKYVEQYIAAVSKEDMDDYKKEMLAKIEPDAPVISSFEFSSWLSARQYYYSFHYLAAGYFRRGLRYDVPENIEYAMVNFEDWRMKFFSHRDTDLNIKTFLESGHFGIVDMAGSVVLFKKGYEGPLKLYDVNPYPASAGVPLLSTAGDLRLAGFDMQKTQGEHTFLNMAFHWIPAIELKETVGMLLKIVDANGHTVYSETCGLGYNVFPTRRWKAGQEVTDYHRLLVPKSLKPGEYRLFVSLFSQIGDERLVLGLYKKDANNIVQQVTSNIMLSTFSIP